MILENRTWTWKPPAWVIFVGAIACLSFYLVLLFRKKKGKRLYTCAVRPAAIYGPGEERHLPRIVLLAKLGLLPFKIGEPNVKSDWIYIDNLVLALLLASMGLLDDIPGSEGNPVAAGQPYFVSDGEDLLINYQRVHVYLTSISFWFIGLDPMV